MKNEKYLYFEIIDIPIFKIIIEVLDKINEIIKLQFIKNNNKLNLIISCSNSTRTLFTKINLNTKIIKNYFNISNESSLEILLEVKDLLNVLKSFEKYDDYLLFYIDKNIKNYIYIEFKSYPDDPDNPDNPDDSNTNKKKSKINNKITKEKKFKINIDTQ